MEEVNKNTEVDNTNKKLHISDIMYRLFDDYKKSIRWNYVLVYYVLFTIFHLMNGCTWYRFFGITAMFMVITLLVWMMSKLERYK